LGAGSVSSLSVDEGSDLRPRVISKAVRTKVLVVWVLARCRLSVLKVLMSAACFIEGGEDEGSGRLGAGSVSSFRIDEGSDVGRVFYRRRRGRRF
jgi:hypothetical protein